MDVASGGELFAALRAGFEPERIYMHGNNKDAAEIGRGVEAGSARRRSTTSTRSQLPRRLPDRRQRVLIRVTPG